jgi:hypothetical protein
MLKGLKVKNDDIMGLRGNDARFKVKKVGR